MKVILLQQKPTKETIWHKLKELFAIRRRCKQIKRLSLPILFFALASTVNAYPICPASITATFTGITFDGCPYNYCQNVNQTFSLSLDRQNSSGHKYCSYHTPPNHFPIPSLGLGIDRDHGLWNAYYQLWYLYAPPDVVSEVTFFQGNNSANQIIFNTHYPANGGVLTITTP